MGVCCFMLRKSGNDWTFALLDERNISLLRGRLYRRRTEALMALEEVRRLTGVCSRHALVTSVGGRHSFRLLSGDGGTIMATGSFFRSPEARDEALEMVRVVARLAPVHEEREIGVPDDKYSAAHSQSPLRNGGPTPGVLGIASASRAAAAVGLDSAFFQLQVTGAGFTLWLRAATGEGLIATLPLPFRAAALAMAPIIREAAPLAAHYTSHLSDTGYYSFRLHDGAGGVLGTSRFYATAAERDQAVERCKREAPTAKLMDAADVRTLALTVPNAAGKV